MYHTHYNHNFYTKLIKPRLLFALFVGLSPHVQLDELPRQIKPSDNFKAPNKNEKLRKRVAIFPYVFLKRIKQNSVFSPSISTQFLYIRGIYIGMNKKLLMYYIRWRCLHCLVNFCVCRCLVFVWLFATTFAETCRKIEKQTEQQQKWHTDTQQSSSNI